MPLTKFFKHQPKYSLLFYVPLAIHISKTDNLLKKIKNIDMKNKLDLKSL